MQMANLKKINIVSFCKMIVKIYLEITGVDASFLSSHQWRGSCKWPRLSSIDATSEEISIWAAFVMVQCYITAVIQSGVFLNAFAKVLRHKRKFIIHYDLLYCTPPTPQYISLSRVQNISVTVEAAILKYIFISFWRCIFLLDWSP